jgi:enterochelin esterase-like enzyme
MVFSLMNRNSRFLLLFIVCMGVMIAACEPLAYKPSPVAVIITNEPTLTPTAPPSPTPTLTFTPSPSPTPFEPTATPFPCTEESGEFIDIDDNRSEIAEENLRYRVYVPPCFFSTQKRFPVVYLLHGLSFREEQWEDLGIHEALDQGIRLGVLPPMLLVMPYMGQIGQVNSFPPEPSYERVILEELMPDIEQNFCTIENREHRAIGGISRGGFWAYSIAMRHPDIFGIVGGHSAYFPNDINEIPPSNNPLELALNSAFVQEGNLRMYLDNGAGDSSGPSQQLFSNRLTQRNIAHTYVVHPVGEHDNDYWSAHVSEYLSFYGSDWERDYGQLPDCAEPSP